MYFVSQKSKAEGTEIHCQPSSAFSGLHHHSNCKKEVSEADFSYRHLPRGCLIFSRMDTHRAVLEAAKRKLTELMKKLTPESLHLLLACSFPYVGVPELRDIPLGVLGQLQPVPPDFLVQLAKDKELFADLPSSVQIQVVYVM